MTKIVEFKPKTHGNIYVAKTETFTTCTIYINKLQPLTPPDFGHLHIHLHLELTADHQKQTDDLESMTDDPCDVCGGVSI